MLRRQYFMQQAKKSLQELIAAVTDELYRIGYSEATVPWRRIKFETDKSN